MSGQGYHKSSATRFALGSLVAFVWRPEGFWLSTENDSSVQKRPDFLINRFANNNYPDREGISDELENDSRIEEENRIITQDHKIVSWPPYDRPVPPFFEMESNGEDQDPKDKEGKFSGRSITNRLKLKKPLSAPYPFSIEECAYPIEDKTGWFLHEPEHIVYLPEEDQPVLDRFSRTVAHYILEYTNELRTHAPFLPPLRGEYSSASFIVQFCKRLGYLDHENSLYPENYQSIRERIEKTRQHPVGDRAWGVSFFWWMGENLQYNTSAIESTSLDEAARFKARSVVDAWIASPAHYPNLVRYDTEEREGVTLLDVAVSGSYFAQTFMGTPFWLNVSNCYWKGEESWQVISWFVPYSRYHKPYGYQLFYKGRVLMSLSDGIVHGACIFLRSVPMVRVAIRLNATLKVYEFEYKNKIFIDGDVEEFTELASFNLVDFISEIGYGENTMDIVQSLMFSSDGQSAVTVLEPRMQQPYRQFTNYLLKFENNTFVYSKESSYTILIPVTYSVVEPLPFFGSYDLSNTEGDGGERRFESRTQTITGHVIGTTLMNVDYQGQTLVTSYYEYYFEYINYTIKSDYYGFVQSPTWDEESGLTVPYGWFRWGLPVTTVTVDRITRESIEGAIIYEDAFDYVQIIHPYYYNIQNGTRDINAGAVITADLRLNAQYSKTFYSTITYESEGKTQLPNVVESSLVSRLKVGTNEYPSLDLNNPTLSDISIADYEGEWIAVVSENDQRQHFASNSTLLNLLSSKDLSKVSLI